VPDKDKKEAGKIWFMKQTDGKAFLALPEDQKRESRAALEQETIIAQGLCDILGGICGAEFWTWGLLTLCGVHGNSQPHPLIEKVARSTVR
jgi:hypothetical protein